MAQQRTAEDRLVSSFLDFGTWLKIKRDTYSLTRVDILKHLPGWSGYSYHRLESGETAPPFDQLESLYRALYAVGMRFTSAERREFLDLARNKIEMKRRRHERKRDADWDELRLRLTLVDGLPIDSGSVSLPRSLRVTALPRLLDTRHLVGRQAWFQKVVASLTGELPAKLAVLQGPSGIGKSSELDRLAKYFLELEEPRYRVISCVFRPVEFIPESEQMLEHLLGTLLSELGPPDVSLPTDAEQQIELVLAYLAREQRPIILLVDNAEHALATDGRIAPCWERCISSFLGAQHRASLVLATKEWTWTGWFAGKRSFVLEEIVPPLPTEDGVLVLQRQGLASVSVELLKETCEQVGGVPLCLEWIAALVQEPLRLDEWSALELDEDDAFSEREQAQRADILNQRLQRLLAEPSLLHSGPIAAKLKPLLDRILENRLSDAARHLLYQLATATVPLGKPALQRVCPDPRLLLELRSASLLAAYRHRVQVLPMVASELRGQLGTQQKRLLEEHLIDALQFWLEEGIVSDREKGMVIAELAQLQFHHERWLDAAQLLLQHGWLSFQCGQAARLARQVEQFWQALHPADAQSQAGLIFLHYHLAQFLGTKIHAQERASAYRPILTAVESGAVLLQPETEIHLLHHFLLHPINMHHFDEAQAILDGFMLRLAAEISANPDLRALLLAKQAWLLGARSEALEKEQKQDEARGLREQTIGLYQECVALLEATEEHAVPLKKSTIKKRRAKMLNDLGCYLHNEGRYEEAVDALKASIDLKKQGYVDPASLAASYGEMSQVLAKLGRFEEALAFDADAVDEIEQYANTGHSFSAEDVATYLVNRARLYLLLGRRDEAEKLLSQWREKLSVRRQIYQLWAETAWNEIQEWRSTSPEAQLDWRWSKRYRDLAAFDVFQWLAHAGPFRAEEQEEWDRLFPHRHEGEARKRLDTLLMQSKQRELDAAVLAQREPLLCFPAIPIDEVRGRLSEALALLEEIRVKEPNVLVRQLYLDALEEQIWYLRMIEATYEGDVQAFQWYNRRIHAEPSAEEMEIALLSVRRLIYNGNLREDTQGLSAQLQAHLQRLGISTDLRTGEEGGLQEPPGDSLQDTHAARLITPETAQRFFNWVFDQYGFAGWETVVDPTAHAMRIEQGLRRFIIPAANQISIGQVRDKLSHEIETHVYRAVAGEHSPLALLGIGTKGALTTEEGLALYYEGQTASLQGKIIDESNISLWIGTMATGLASGVLTPPQSFYQLFSLLEPLLLLYRRVYQLDATLATSLKKAQELALVRCLRTFRGAGPYVKDVIYLRGFRMVRTRVQENPAILENLMVGVVGIEQLPTLKQLGIVTPPARPQWLAQSPDLAECILAFE